MKKQLQLDENSRILCFSTEGDTDKDGYRRIVWDGENPSF
jgi:diaminopropionate ammonia-lyase